MADYSTEIAALRAAIASGVTEVRDGERTVRYDSFDALMKRLNWLLGLQGTVTTGPQAGFASFDRGDR